MAEEIPGVWHNCLMSDQGPQFSDVHSSDGSYMLNYIDYKLSDGVSNFLGNTEPQHVGIFNSDRLKRMAVDLYHSHSGSMDSAHSMHGSGDYQSAGMHLTQAHSAIGDFHDEASQMLGFEHPAVLNLGKVLRHTQKYVNDYLERISDGN